MLEKKMHEEKNQIFEMPSQNDKLTEVSIY